MMNVDEDDKNLFAVALLLEGLSDEGGTEAQATALAEGLASIGHPAVFATRWPLDRHGARVARMRSAGVEVLTPKWAGAWWSHFRVSSYNVRRTIRIGQFLVSRRALPTRAGLASDRHVLRSRDRDVRVVLIRKLRRWIHAQQPLPTVLHVLARHTAVLIPDLRALGLPILYSELGQPEYYTGGGVPTQAFEVEAMTADSVEAAQFLEARYARTVHVIPSIGGFSEPTAAPALRATRFVMVNRLHPDKRVEIAIRAMARAGPHCVLDVLGSGPSMAELNILIKSLDVSDRVTLHGSGNRSRVKAFLDAGDAFILTSSTEGTPTSVLEAMSRARCVVAVPVGGVPDLVRHGREGLFFDGTVDDLSMAMCRLTEEAGLARALGCAARERWMMHFSPEKIVKRYEALYREVLSARLDHLDGCPQ